MDIVELLSSVKQWEQETSTIRIKAHELAQKQQALEILKRELISQIDRHRVDEQSSKELYEKLMEDYESVRQQVIQYEVTHRPNIDRAKYD